MTFEKKRCLFDAMWCFEHVFQPWLVEMWKCNSGNWGFADAWWETVSVYNINIAAWYTCLLESGCLTSQGAFCPETHTLTVCQCDICACETPPRWWQLTHVKVRARNTHLHKAGTQLYTSCTEGIQVTYPLGGHIGSPQMTTCDLALSEGVDIVSLFANKSL